MLRRMRQRSKICTSQVDDATATWRNRSDASFALNVIGCAPLRTLHSCTNILCRLRDWYPAAENGKTRKAKSGRFSSKTKSGRFSFVVGKVFLCSREGFPQSFCSREGFPKSFCSRESFVVRKYSETRKMTTPYEKPISGEVTFSWPGESNRPSSLPSITTLQQTL